MTKGKHQRSMAAEEIRTLQLEVELLKEELAQRQAEEKVGQDYVKLLGDNERLRLRVLKLEHGETERRTLSSLVDKLNERVAKAEAKSEKDRKSNEKLVDILLMLAPDERRQERISWLISKLEGEDFFVTGNKKETLVRLLKGRDLRSLPPKLSQIQ